ncbi:MAG: hypothetical protein PVJ92_01985 [Candidatus Dependentiae bacterium]|jgi:hypothetical protein
MITEDQEVQAAASAFEEAVTEHIVYNGAEAADHGLEIITGVRDSDVESDLDDD